MNKRSTVARDSIPYRIEYVGDIYGMIFYPVGVERPFIAYEKSVSYGHGNGVPLRRSRHGRDNIQSPT